MRFCPVLFVLAAMTLAACDSKAPAPAPEPAQPPVAEPAVKGEEQRIVALGDSLFAGYGVAAEESYPARLEAHLRATGRNVRVANAGVSGDTSAGGRQRLAFTLDGQPRPPALLLVSLGGNDMLRGLPPAQTRDNLAAILDEAQRRKIPVVLMGMLAPPNMGAEFRRDFDAIYPALGKRPGVTLVPFFLQAVIDTPALIQPDHIHPTAPGIDRIVAATAQTVAGALPKG